MLSPPEMYPWLDSVWHSLLDAWDRLPQALAFSGPPGCGKRQLAMHYSAARLCRDTGAGAAPCGRCRNCHLLGAGTHPDLYVLKPPLDLPWEPGLLSHYAQRLPVPRPASDRSGISVDQVRQLVSSLNGFPHSATHQIAMICSAESMNLNAANALLKFLEEPPDRTLILLVGEELQLLPATVRSRCMPFPVPMPDRADSLAWLQETIGAESDAEALLNAARNSPLRARAMSAAHRLAICHRCIDDCAALCSGAVDPLAVAARWHEGGLADHLRWAQEFIVDRIRAGFRQPAPGEAQSDGDTLACSPERGSLIELFLKLGELKFIIGTGIDERLSLEDVIIQWYESGERARV